LPRVLADPNDLEARGRMLLGAALAGMAIENSMLGAAHSCANPLTAHYDVVHGEAVGLMLPHVMRFNAAQDNATRLAYAELASAPEIACVSEGLDQATAALIVHVEELLNLAGIARSLTELRVTADALPSLATEASRQWTAQFNPRPVAEPDFLKLFEAALEPRPNGTFTSAAARATPRAA
jgi:alcohol dehydrogenase